MNSYWESFKIKWSQDRKKIINFFDSVSSLVNVLSFIILIIITAIMLIFTITQISIVLQRTPFLKPAADAIFETIGINVTSLSQIEYNAIISSASSAVALFVTIWFAGFSTINFSKHRRDLKRLAIIKTRPIHKMGVDDLKVMLEYYKIAEKVTVYSGDFDWLVNNNLKSVIEKLGKENKIKLYSFRDETTVKKAINDEVLFTLLKPNFQFNNNTKDIKCSIVETKGFQVFLYLSIGKIVGGEDNVCIVQNINEGQYLVKIVDNLLKNVSISSPSNANE